MSLSSSLFLLQWSVCPNLFQIYYWIFFYYSVFRVFIHSSNMDLLCDNTGPTMCHMLCASEERQTKSLSSKRWHSSITISTVLPLVLGRSDATGSQRLGHKNWEDIYLTAPSLTPLTPSSKSWKPQAPQRGQFQPAAPAKVSTNRQHSDDQTPNQYREHCYIEKKNLYSEENVLWISGFFPYDRWVCLFKQARLYLKFKTFKTKRVLSSFHRHAP